MLDSVPLAASFPRCFHSHCVARKAKLDRAAFPLPQEGRASWAGSRAVPCRAIPCREAAAQRGSSPSGGQQLSPASGSVLHPPSEQQCWIVKVKNAAGDDGGTR